MQKHITAKQEAAEEENPTKVYYQMQNDRKQFEENDKHNVLVQC